MSKPIQEALNLGPKSAVWLKKVGIHTLADLKRLGSIQAFIKVRKAGFKPSLNLLYALEGAVTNTLWNKLSMEKRMELDMKVNPRSKNPL